MPAQTAEQLKSQLKKPVRVIGLVIEEDSDGDKWYHNLVFQLVDGKVTSTELYSTDATESQAINSATGWLDHTYWPGGL